MKRILSYAAAFFCITAALIFFACGAAAGENAEAAMAALSDPNGPVVGIAHRGDWHTAPENSQSAILNAVKAGLRFVSADVSLTKDGVPVLLEATGAKRMLGTETEAVSDYTLEELKALKLKDRNGGKNNKETAEQLLTLTEFLQLAASNDFAAVPVCDAAIADAVFKTVTDENAAGFTVVLLTGKGKAIKAAASANAKTVPMIGAKRSNVLFDVWSFTDAMEESGALGVNLMTTNRYGINFNQSVLGRLSGKLRAVANTADAVTCGAREDTVKWWDDLVSRGYSVILTDDPQAFSVYLSDAAQARSRLQETYTYSTAEWQPPKFRNNALNDYKKAYTDAETAAKALLEDQSASLQDMRDATAALVAAVDEIDLNYEALETGAAGKAVTLPRILLCVAAAGVVLWVQIFFYKKRKKG